MEEFSIEEFVDHFGESKILHELGYDEELCFENDSDVVDYIIDNSQYLGIKFEPEYRYHNDQDVYNRVVELLNKDKLSISEWDEFLQKYE